MAAPANTFQTHSVKGLREDLSDIIHNLMVTDTPLYSKSTKKKAKAVKHEWLTDEIRQGADNAHVDGDDTAANARTPRVRLQNYTQIFKEAVIVSGSANAGDYAGSRSVLADEMFKAMKAVKRDVEFAMFKNQAAVAGNNTTARRMAGLPAWIATNTVAGSGGVDPTGDGTDTRTDGTAANFVEADLKTTLQNMWNEGAKPDTVYLRPDLLDTASAFTGNAPRREMKDSGKVSATIDVYVTNFGEVQFVPHREIRATDVIVTDSSRVYVAEFRSFKQEPLAKTGDAEKRQIVGELTLAPGNEKALGIIADRQAV